VVPVRELAADLLIALGIFGLIVLCVLFASGTESRFIYTDF